MAADLAKLRTAFVEKVSKEIVKQLLDNLLEDKIINSGEGEAILEENLTTADKARKLIDSVKKKGDKASNKLIFYLQNRDATLYEDLCQCCGLPANLAVQETMGQHKALEEHDGLSLIKSTERFWIEKHNSKDSYAVSPNSKLNRVALIITNISFANIKYRNGAEKDEENMEKLLTALGYEVVKYTNLTATQMDEALIRFSKHRKLKETDSVFVIIMSHGKLGAVLGVNYKPDCSPDEKSDELPVDNIFKHLNAQHCPALVDKPKIIIIQACRGDKKGSVIVSDNLESDDFAEEDIEEDISRYTHVEKDFICLLSSTPHTVSNRHKIQGSFLIQFVVKVFNTYAHKDGIEELFRKVMRQFEEDEELPVWFKQMATKDRCTLTRLFYLFPGL